MSADYVEYDGTNGKSYKELKQAAIDALTKTGVSFVWKYEASKGDIVTANQLNEIRSALDSAYDALNTGCNSKDTGYCGSNYGYTSRCITVYSAYNQSVHSSNLSAQMASALTALNSTQNNTYQ